ncbi:MAG: methylmalonyl-CoA mutase family protein [Acidimicrobiales bacterium]|nr:methylmalonyl-CoA mutase family protein [Acidimicrobiales bacterium]
MPAPGADRPWIMRTYSGHSSAAASNELYRTNLAKGQTGLSIAFDLPTQTGYDPDHVLARGEVGKVGVPVTHLGDMATLLEDIPVDSMNTSMTINAPAAWLLALYVAHAETQGVARAALRGTTQNDIVKEYLSRGTYIFPPEPSKRLIVDTMAFCAAEVPKWNPINICSYHLQEAGATPVQEIAMALATAVDVLDAVRASGQVDEDRFVDVVAAVSFFANAGIRFVEETCKMRAFTQMWDRITAERYGVTDPKARRFRYGVQVNSLGLTAEQPENNVHRIGLEILGVTLSKDARARSIQLPAWNEALGLPRPWDQQWSLRMQQILAHESDLLEYDDIFAGSHVIEGKTAGLVEASTVALDEIIDQGGAFANVESLKAQLVRSHAERRARIEQGDLTVVGVNEFTEAEPSPLGGAASILQADPQVESRLVAALDEWRSSRDQSAVDEALARLSAAAADGTNIMEPSIALAHVGGTTGEWADTLRQEFGEYRGPTGVAAAGPRPPSSSLAATRRRLDGAVPPRVLIAKPGLDGHSNGAEQLALAGRDAGMEVIYVGIRSTPEQIAQAAQEEDVDLIGLSILSGSHLSLVRDTIAALAAHAVDAPVVVGGIIPDADHADLHGLGVARIYTPADYDLGVIVGEMAELALAHRS